MKVSNQLEDGRAITLDTDGPDTLRRMLSQAATTPSDGALTGVVVGELLGAVDGSQTPYVIFSGQIGAAPVAARSAVALPELREGRHVVLVFENCDATKPIIIGVLRETDSRGHENVPPALEVEADGQRLTIHAREQLVLRCGQASITLTKAGKVLIKGEYVSTRSSGVNRIKGGSVQIN